jgi:hypothetical protein
LAAVKIHIDVGWILLAAILAGHGLMFLVGPEMPTSWLSGQWRMQIVGAAMVGLAVMPALLGVHITRNDSNSTQDGFGDSRRRDDE